MKYETRPPTRCSHRAARKKERRIEKEIRMAERSVNIRAWKNSGLVNKVFGQPWEKQQMSKEWDVEREANACKFYRIYRTPRLPQFSLDNAWWWSQQTVLFIVFLKQTVEILCVEIGTRRKPPEYPCNEIIIIVFVWAHVRTFSHYTLCAASPRPSLSHALKLPRFHFYPTPVCALMPVVNPRAVTNKTTDRPDLSNQTGKWATTNE